MPSADFIHWTKAVEVLRGDRTNQTYAMPVFRHAGVYLGLLAIFNTQTDRTHCELAWSADTVAWHRIQPGTPLIPTATRRDAYDWGCVYPAAVPVVRENEIRLYYGASNGPHTNWRDGFLALATLRPDGFAGWTPQNETKPAVVLTRPLPPPAKPCASPRMFPPVAGCKPPSSTPPEPCSRKAAASPPPRPTGWDSM